MNKSKEIFFALLKAGLWAVNDSKPIVEGSLFWDEVYNLASEQSVVGILTAGIDHYKLIDSLNVPIGLKLNFIGESLQIEQRNLAMNEFVAKLVMKLSESGVYTLLVKGQSLGQCYEKPLWRTSGDVDLFLNDDNYNKAKDLLLPLATEVEQEYKGVKHLGMTIDGWVVELHGSLRMGVPSHINRVLDEIQHETFYEGNVRSWNNNNVKVCLLGVENDIFYVFVHYLNHFYKGGIGLRQICDWCRLMWTYKESIDYRKLELRIRKARLMSEWRAFGAFAVEYLGMDAKVVPFLNHNDIFNRQLKKKTENIRDFILMSGNFGHNRDLSYFNKFPFLIRKCCSLWLRVSDLYNHAKIFPLDSLFFLFAILKNGIKGAMRGEG